jgi:hypothetical protein
MAKKPKPKTALRECRLREENRRLREENRVLRDMLHRAVGQKADIVGELLGWTPKPSLGGWGAYLQSAVSRRQTAPARAARAQPAALSPKAKENQIRAEFVARAAALDKRDIQQNNLFLDYVAAVQKAGLRGLHPIGKRQFQRAVAEHRQQRTPR